VIGGLGRDTTLTGRTDIWPYVLKKIEERPILGYGFFSFWEMEAIASYVQEVFQWSIPSAHSGYLEILLGLGWVGLALVIAFLFTMGYRLVTMSQHLEPGVVAFALPSLAYYLLFNIVESAFLVSSGLSWIVVVTAMFLMTPDLPAIRRAALGA
ncbi:MAG: O-antigen ligase family protein, partial [Alphaproteobacteria bacterium]|nr:O-antigen ligase family protein [Alphaproteobacteria bacterium]